MLRCCPKLHKLHIVQCVGPFGPGLVDGLPLPQHLQAQPLLQAPPQLSVSLGQQQPGSSSGGDSRPSASAVCSTATAIHLAGPELVTSLVAAAAAVAGPGSSSLPVHQGGADVPAAVQGGPSVLGVSPWASLPYPSHRWPLTELHLSGGGGNVTLTDLHLQQLINSHQTPPHTHTSTATSAGSSGSGSSSSSRGSLTCLGLVGFRTLSDSLCSYLLSHHAGSLQHLRLEYCGEAISSSPPLPPPSTDHTQPCGPTALRSSSPPALQPCGPTATSAVGVGAAAAGGHLQPPRCAWMDEVEPDLRVSGLPASAATAAAVQAPPPCPVLPTSLPTRTLTSAAVVQLLLGCGKLRSVRLRHCCQVG